MAATRAPAFLSYARANSAFALRLAADLKRAKANVWLDQLDIPPGLQWDRAVEQAVIACQEVIVLLSPASVDSNNVMDEVAYALDERKTLIPLLIEECRIPFRLRRLQHIDFRSSYDAGLNRLLSTLAAETKAASPAAVPEAGSPPPGKRALNAAPEAEVPKSLPVKKAPPQARALAFSKSAAPLNAASARAARTNLLAGLDKRAIAALVFAIALIGVVAYALVHSYSTPSPQQTFSFSPKKQRAGEQAAASPLAGSPGDATVPDGKTGLGQSASSVTVSAPGGSAAHQRIRVGSQEQAAKLLQEPRPAYPDLAKKGRVQGTVRLKLVIGKDGKVATVSLISGHPFLVPAAMDAVKRWVYAPTLLNGMPVEVETEVDVDFALKQ